MSELAADGAGWRVDGISADAVVLACPASARRAAPRHRRRSTTIPTADVALVTLTIDASTWPHRLTGRSGYLVPKPRQRLVTAASFGSQKWAHWQVPGKVVLRISLGRDGLPVAAPHRRRAGRRALSTTPAGTSAVDLQPADVRVSRFPGAFPQYRPHHAALVAGAEAALPAGIAFAGASYHGIGIPACIRSARNAADRVVEHLRGTPE